ncbi:hypothetical protein ACN70_13905 [Escherichia coli]|nr:hypothetical protein ACN70_13905 [Escherichia coli]
MIPEQSPQAIYHHFLKIRERNNVSDVLVEITMFDDPDWPFSESILVITTASPEEVQSWFVEEIAPDECWEGWSEDTEHGWWICPYISRHLLSLNPLLACCRRYSRGER